jgi:hypothetical protein
MKIKVEVEISPEELSVLRDIRSGLQGSEATETIDEFHEWMANAFDMAESGLLSVDPFRFDYSLTKIGRSVIDKSMN